MIPAHSAGAWPGGVWPRIAPILILAEGAAAGAYSQIRWTRAHYQLDELIWRLPAGLLLGAAAFYALYLGAYVRFLRGESAARAGRESAAIDAWSFAALPFVAAAWLLGPARFVVAWLAWLAWGALKAAALFKLAGLRGARHWTRGAIVSIFSVGLTLLAAELGLRVYLDATQQTIDMLDGYQRRKGPEVAVTLADLIRRDSNPRLLYRGEPNADGLLLDQRVTLNALGFRGAGFAETKPPQTRRIAVLGDSYTFGFGVANDQTYPVYLEQALNAQRRAVNYEVLNFGVAGYNTIQEVETLKTVVLRFQPDVVLVQYFMNDLSPPFFMAARRHYLREGGCLLVSWFAHRAQLSSRQLKQTDELKAAARATGMELNFDTGINNPFPGLEQVPADYRYLAGWENFEAALAELGAISRRKNLPVCLLTFASPGEAVPDVKRLSALAAQHGLRFADVSAEFNIAIAASGKPVNEYRLWGRDFHYSPAGNRLMADIILRRLQEWNLL